VTNTDGSCHFAKSLLTKDSIHQHTGPAFHRTTGTSKRRCNTYWTGKAAKGTVGLSPRAPGKLTLGRRSHACTQNRSHNRPSFVWRWLNDNKQCLAKKRYCCSPSSLRCCVVMILAGKSWPGQPAALILILTA